MRKSTLTSVGYGDISPETVPGKIVAMFVQVSGAIALLLGLGQIDEYVREMYPYMSWRCNDRA